MKENSVDEDLSNLFGVRPQIMKLINARGIVEKDDIRAYLYPHYSDLHSPFMLDNMHEAVTRIRAAISGRERIGIFADSDLDGITSLTVMYQMFSKMGTIPYLRYLKDRENYGITEEIIDEFKKEKTDLLITVDSGIRDIKEIAYARNLGIDVIVTDHHEPDATLPDAIVVNPKLSHSSYPNAFLAGVGVAFKICHATLMSYLPSYNRLFSIVSSENGEMSLSIIQNGIVRSEYHHHERINDEDIARKALESDWILHHDLTPRQLGSLMEALPEEGRALPFSDFIKRVFSSSISDIRQASKEFSIIREYHDSEHDFLVNLFNEVQIRGSDKMLSFIQEIMPFVAIGSIADVVPLKNENRSIVKIGLREMETSRHSGLARLVNGSRADSRLVAWDIAPLLNTPGRDGKTHLTVDFFLPKKSDDMDRTINEIRSLNTNRKNVINTICIRLLDKIGSRDSHSTNGLIYIRDNDIPNGYAGLIAGRLSDKTEMPVVVAVETDEPGVLKGSGRIKGGGKFFSFFSTHADRFIRIGGHEQAFGFTVHEENIDEIIADINTRLGECNRDVLNPVVDMELDIRDINEGLIEEMGILEPFGNGNERPVFLSRSLTISTFEMMGKNHGKYYFNGTRSLCAIGWQMADEMKEKYQHGTPVDILYNLENNRFNGRLYPRMIIATLDHARSDY